MTGFDYLVVSDVSSKHEELDICCFVFGGAGVYFQCEIRESFSFLQSNFKEFAQNLSIWPPSAMSKWNICSCYRMPGKLLVITFVLFFQLCLLKTTTTNIWYSTFVTTNVLHSLCFYMHRKVFSQKKIRKILCVSKFIGVFESPLLCIWKFVCSVHILTAKIFESGPMPTLWNFLDRLPLLPSCKFG